MNDRERQLFLNNEDMEKLYKRYCDVEVRTTKEGEWIPLAIYWESGGECRRYEIDRILEGPLRRASPVGGCGLRYVVKICGQVRTLFKEHQTSTNTDRYFIESHHP